MPASDPDISRPNASTAPYSELDSSRSRPGRPAMPPRYLWAALITAAVIVYGSLNPFDFYAGRGGNPVLFLLAHWRTPAQSPAGFVANIVLYLPLGLFIGLAGSDRHRASRVVLAAGLISLALCVSVELVQFYDWGRQTTLTDVYLNVLGGVLGGWIATRIPARLRQPVGDLGQPGVWALLAAFGVIELYPFVPTLNTGWYADALSSLWRHPHIDPLGLARETLRWLVAACLFGQLIGARRTRVLLPIIMLVVFCAQIVMLNIWLSITEWTGALIALALWLGLATQPRQRRAGVIAAALALVLLAEHLLPWHEQSGAPLGSVFGFADVDGLSPIATARHVIAHFYAAGALVWLTAIAGVGRWRAAGGTAVFFLGLALIQTRDAGHPPGLTDTLLAVLAGVLFIGACDRDEPV
ncbi:VanZ family protein [Salinisphaera hydrothermalis]|uniref:VanZ family protein n=1 Tax=Salinisphaera hydrothermalis TaxID=563188 RepID=UPI0033428F5F